MSATPKTLEERYRERVEELLTLRKEVNLLQEDKKNLQRENARLRRRVADNPGDRSRKIPDSEFLLAIERILKTRTNAKEARREDPHAKLPPKLSITAVAQELGVTDANIHKNYPHIKTLIMYRQDKSNEELLAKFRKESSKLKASLKAVKAERDKRFIMCENMANQLLKIFIGQNKRNSCSSQPIHCRTLMIIKPNSFD